MVVVVAAPRCEAARSAWGDPGSDAHEAASSEAVATTANSMRPAGVSLPITGPQ